MRIREGISWGTQPDGRALPVSPRYGRMNPGNLPGSFFCAEDSWRAYRSRQGAIVPDIPGIGLKRCRGRTYGEDLPVNRLRMNSRGPWRYHRIHNHAKTDRSAQEAILVRTTGKAPQWPKKPSP